MFRENLNVEKAASTKVLSSEKIAAVHRPRGGHRGIDDSFDIAKLRYHGSSS